MFGAWFAAIMFLKFLIDAVTAMIRACEINTLSRNSMNIGKVFLSAVFNVFYVTAIANVFRPQNDEDEKQEKSIQKRKEEQMIEMQDFSKEKTNYGKIWNDFNMDMELQKQNFEKLMNERKNEHVDNMMNGKNKENGTNPTAPPL